MLLKESYKAEPKTFEVETADPNALFGKMYNPSTVNQTNFVFGARKPSTAKGQARSRNLLQENPSYSTIERKVMIDECAKIKAEMASRSIYFLILFREQFQDRTNEGIGFD